MIRSKGVLPIGQAIPGAVAELLRLSPLSPGKVDFAWRTAVGPAVQRVTAVRLENGVLIVDTSSRQWSLELTRSSPVILRRMQSLLGTDVIKEIAVRA
jgi:predicted nucleic acid-binding Zn ribbon protein